MREEAAIDLLLTPLAVIVRRAEVLEGAEARDRVERAEALADHLPRVIQVHVEAVATAGGDLCRGQGHADSLCADAADKVEQPTPAAAQVEDPASWLDPDLLGHVVVLASLSLFEGQREVAVVLGSAEVRELPQARRITRSVNE